MLNHKISTPAFALCLALSSFACADFDDSSVEAQTRSLSLDVEVELETEGGDNGTVIWEILEAGINGGFTTWEVVETAGGDNGTVIWEILEAGVNGVTTSWEIKDPNSGAILCTISNGELVDDATNSSVLELAGDYVELPSGASLYEFDQDELLSASRGTLLVSASLAQQGASEGRRLTIAALAGGHCR